MAAGERMWSNTTSSRTAPVTPASTGTRMPSCPAAGVKSACQPTQTIV